MGVQDRRGGADGGHVGADKVIVGGHFSQLKDGVKRERLGMINLSDGSVDSSWAPPVSGKYLGPWDLLVDDNHLYVGGEFTSVAGLPATISHASARTYRTPRAPW